jgi:aminoglycoside phosphotransferase (APT) family kinase protein
MVIGSSNGGFVVPGWLVRLIAILGAVVGATWYVIRDRASVEERLHRVEQRQCAVLAALRQTDQRFDSQIFKEGCP